MIEIIDQTGVKLVLNKTAGCIISLVPSITELLYDLQLEKEVKGITLFCIHPEHWRNTKTRIGGTKKIKHELIEKLQPDLILANKEENTKEDIVRLRKNFQVYTSDIKNLNDALEMIRHTGLLTDREKQCNELIPTVRNKFENLKKGITGKPDIKTIYLIWQNPYMTAGGDTFIHDMMKAAGFKNVFSRLMRYPEITIEQIKESGAEVVLLSSEPFPFKEKHLHEIQKLIPQAKVHLVNGTFFSWYGSRLKESPDYLINLRNEISLNPYF